MWYCLIRVTRGLQAFLVHSGLLVRVFRERRYKKNNNQTNIFVPLIHLPPAPLCFDKCLFTQGDLGPVGGAGPRGLPGVGLTGPKVRLGNTQKEKFRL